MSVLSIGSADDLRTGALVREREIRGGEPIQGDADAWPRARPLTLEVSAADMGTEVGDDVDRISLTDLETAVERAAMRTVGVLELTVTGVDVIDEGDRPRVLEADPSPVFATFGERIGTTVVGAPSEFLANP